MRCAFLQRLGGGLGARTFRNLPPGALSLSCTAWGLGGTRVCGLGFGGSYGLSGSMSPGDKAVAARVETSSMTWSLLSQSVRELGVEEMFRVEGFSSGSRVHQLRCWRKLRRIPKKNRTRR